MKSSRSNVNITPLGARGRDLNILSVYSPLNMDPQIDLDFIGLRYNKSHLKCSD